MKSNGTLLIVDDELAGRKNLEILLMTQGYNLAFASDGAEALAQAAKLAPDLILLDVMMPGMDGYEVCQRLRADPLLAEVPVVMVTALDDHDSRLRGIEAGADDFIPKPFNRAELRARVRTITRLNRYRRLLAERTKFEWAVEQAGEGYLMVNDDDEVLYANPRARLYLDLVSVPLADSREQLRPGQVGQAQSENERTSEGFLDLARKQYHCEPQEAWATWPKQPAGEWRSPRYLVRPESSTAKAMWLQVEALDLPPGTGMGRVVRLHDVTAEVALQRDTRGFHDLISHKMRTPLISMLSGTELLMQYADKLSTDEIVQFSSVAHAGSERLHSALEDILQYLDAPGLAEPGARFGLSQLEPAVAGISSDLGIESVLVSCPEDLLASRVLLSQRAVELVLWEILENSQKFHPEQTPKVEISVSRAGPSEIRFRISDDGLTISPEHLGRIWTPYYQGEKYFTGEVQGMGLGLAMVAALVWEVGGTCRAYNREDGPGVVVELAVPT